MRYDSDDVKRDHALRMSEAFTHHDDLEALHHANRLLTVGTLTAGMAHELGTPLGIVLARAQMIALDAEDVAEARKDAEEIVKQVVRMTRMCREVLDYARPKPQTRDAVNIALIVRQTMELLAPNARERGARLVLTSAPESELVLGDASKLMQLLANLIINGAQAMPRGGVVSLRVERKHVTSLVMPNAEYICVSVSDTGSGIKSCDLRHIFETFFTTKPRGEGTGLGLAVSHRFAREHAGFIGVDTVVNVGTTFTLYLPIIPGGSSQEPLPLVGDIHINAVTPSL